MGGESMPDDGPGGNDPVICIHAACRPGSRHRDSRIRVFQAMNMSVSHDGPFGPNPGPDGCLIQIMPVSIPGASH